MDTAAAFRVRPVRELALPLHRFPALPRGNGTALPLG